MLGGHRKRLRYRFGIGDVDSGVSMSSGHERCKCKNDILEFIRPLGLGFILE